MKRSRRPPRRALASTVLRSSAVNENSAATNTALPKVSTTMANTLTAVVVTFTTGSVLGMVFGTGRVMPEDPATMRLAARPGSQRARRVPAARHPFRSTPLPAAGLKITGIHMLAKPFGMRSPAEGQRVSLGEARR
jgi:ABC-type amino acid transport system permease subunit